MRNCLVLIIMLAAPTALVANNAPANLYTGNSAYPDAKKVKAVGEFSKLYDSEEEAKLNSPTPKIDQACGQELYAAVFDQSFECQKEHGQFKCKQTQQADCIAR